MSFPYSNNIGDDKGTVLLNDLLAVLVIIMIIIIYLFIYLFFIFISLTTKGKVSTEGNEAYRGVTYKKEHIQTLVQKTKQLQKQKYKTTTYRDNKKINLLNRTQKVIQQVLKTRTAGYREYIEGDTIPKINTINKKGIPIRVNGGLFT